MNEDQCAMPQLRDIPESLNNLNRVIENVENVLHELASRLNPVLIERDGPEPCNLEMISKAKSQIAYTVEEYTDRLRAIDSRIYALMQGLQL